MGRLLSPYRDRVLPRINDHSLSSPVFSGLRTRACAPLSGEVLEIGFGSGLNLAHLPTPVTAVLAVEPSPTAWKLAGPRIAASRIPVTRVGDDARAIDLPDASADHALSSWTLCTVPDIATVLAEVRRVVRPGGTLCFLEHGRSPDRRTAARQNWFDPVNRCFGGGCTLKRHIPSLIEAAGFTLKASDEFDMGGGLMGHHFLGVAVN